MKFYKNSPDAGYNSLCQFVRAQRLVCLLRTSAYRKYSNIKTYDTAKR